MKKIIGPIISLLGVGVLIYVLFPIVSYQMSAHKYGQYISPVPVIDTLQSEIDFTRASNWFADDVTPEDFKPAKIGFYTISIPSLNIDNATVAIGGEDLEKSLIQYPGTALPGKRGNAVIFGHSILPQFYDPKNYLAIFSKLPDLLPGDEIQIGYDGINYNYIVEDLFEVSPTDIHILEQNTANSFLSLVTCTPPGHPLRPKRLIVRAKIAPFSSSLSYGITRD